MMDRLLLPDDVDIYMLLYIVAVAKPLYLHYSMFYPYYNPVPMALELNHSKGFLHPPPLLSFLYPIPLVSFSGSG